MASNVLNNALNPNGDGSPGIGVMHMDFQGITSARLRNPMLIPAGGTATVSFFAPRFVTTGHWWEIAITPTQQTTAADFTAVPGRQAPESLSDPLTASKCPGNDGGCTNGPGNRVQVADSINVISTGWPDRPTCDGSNWYTRYAVTKAANGTVSDFVNPAGSQDKLPLADPQENVTRELYPWQIVYASDGITLKSDFKGDGTLQTIAHWNVSIPWSEVYVNLLYVAYQADHHPQAGCGYGQFGVAQAEEMGWRHVAVSPVKYKHTYAVPTTAVDARNLGFLFYDLRDVGAHFGTPVNGRPQPNTAAYDDFGGYLYCWQGDPNGGLLCGDPSRTRNSVNLNLTISAQQMQGLAQAKLHADVRFSGSVAIQINGQVVTPLDGVAANLPPDRAGFTFEPNVWVERSTTIDPSLLHLGSNTIQLTLQPQPGYYSSGHGFNSQPVIEIDRIELELYNTQ